MSTIPHVQMLDSFSSLRRELSLIFANGLKGSGLGHQQMVILYRLSQSSCSMSELSTYTQSDPAATSRTVTGLEEAHFIKRSVDSKDGRKSIVQLTSKGKAQAEIALEIRNRIGSMLIETLNSTERKEFCRLLEKITAGLQEKRKSEVRNVPRA